MGPPAIPGKTRVQLLRAPHRIKTLIERKKALAKAARRDIADLIDRNKLERASIKVETMIQDDIACELLEILEIYTELLIARYALLEQNTTREPDVGIRDAVVSIVYAAHHTEIKELQVVRETLMQYFGRDWAIGVMDNRDDCVPARITNKVVAYTPPQTLIDAYLGEIARGYGLSWRPPKNVLNGPPSTLNAEAVEAATLAETSSSTTKADGPSTPKDTVEANESSTKDAKDRVPPNVATHRIESKTPPQDDDTLPSYTSSTKPAVDAKGDEEEDEIDVFASLQKRFAALKSRGR